MTELTYVLSGVGLFLLGFGVSQLAFTIRLAGQIRVNTTEIQGVKDDFLRSRKETNQRFTDMVNLIGKVVDQNSLVIAELKVRK